MISTNRPGHQHQTLRTFNVVFIRLLLTVDSGEPVPNHPYLLKVHMNDICNKDGIMSTLEQPNWIPTPSTIRSLKRFNTNAGVIAILRRDLYQRQMVVRATREVNHTRP